MLTVEGLKKEYALSCIENYLLYILNESGYKWSALFYKSFVSVESILYNLTSGRDYSHFNGVPRLHHLAMDMGIVELTYYDKSMNIDAFGNNYFAIQVSIDYMKKRYNYEPWRDDHYILMRNYDGSIVYYLNDSPIDSGTMSVEKALSLCNGAIIKFCVIKDINSGIFDKLVLFVQNAINSMMDRKTSTPCIGDISFEQARDIVSVTKTLVKRQEEFIKLIDTDYDASDYYNFLISAQTKIEYYRIKKRNQDKVTELLNQVVLRDKIHYKNLKEVLGVYV